MRRIVLGLAVALAIGSPLRAEGLRELATRDAGAGWQAVGVLAIGTSRQCTGALIAPDLVLTAAHCLFETGTHRQIDAATIEFRAGWRSGRAEAYRGVRRIVVHPGYIYEDPDRIARIVRDIAVLELDRPIRQSGVTPFGTVERTRPGAEVGVVSYARGREQAPSLERLCHVLARDGGALMLSCDVDLGASGAPVFVMEDGQPRIVSVVSAMAESDGARVALAAEVGTALPDLMALLHPGNLAGARTFAGSGGARFLRPETP